MDLSLLSPNQSAIITEISPNYQGEKRQRLLDLGFTKGSEINIQNISPLGDPTSYLIHNTINALRKEDAQNIIIEIKTKSSNDKIRM